MIQPFPYIGALALACLAACTPAEDDAGAPQVSRLSQLAPPDAEPGTCWGKQTDPAVIETVTHQIEAQPAELAADGSVLSPATYRTETRQQIVRERKETWFETPCADRMTPEFVASIQRALKVRGLYRGKISGELDKRTQTAIRRFQTPGGLDSTTLSLDAARKLGLVAVERNPQ